MDTNLNADLENYLNASLDSVNKKMIEQEQARHQLFLKKHSEEYDALSQKHDSYISQLITLEGVVFGAVVVLSNPEQTSIWLILSISLILISLIFGIWSQRIAKNSRFESHMQSYYNEIKNNWWTRELWKDDTVKLEKQLIEPHIEDRKNSYKKTTGNKILKIFRLNADRIENIFVISFILALFLLIIHTFFKAPILTNLNNSTHINNHPIQYRDKLNKRTWNR